MSDWSSENWFGLITGLLIGDKGFISKDLDEECDDHAIDLRTPLKRNTAAQGGSQPIDARKARVETTIGQLARKILACNMSLSFKQRLSDGLYC